ncbi:YheC/D-like protein [Melghirimyces profundicolus]|uniref:YheC/D-like protein n=1 Tax=Melghirimyces profundicolus TaxID=1242148 RepID=A0A2T6C4L9_9BACL|nr:YheC/YheD family protein [Melghirimyces profundicolus]PTX63269.1 YheC/D-like protein [Melghirimyces profundicolus]
MNSFPKTGWLVFTPDGNGPVFIPRRRITGTDAAAPVTMNLGARLKKTVSIRRANKKFVHRPLMCPARLKEIQGGEWKAGPFIGILTSGTLKGFMGNRSNFIDLIRTGRRMGVTIFVLTPEGLKEGAHTVQGFLLNPGVNGNRWVPATLPIPDVVYNRIPSRKLESRAQEQKILATLSNMTGVSLFNPSFFNKWTLHLHMQRSPRLARLLPDTARWNGGKLLKEMVTKHSTLFLKPVEGKAGHGMIRVTRKNRGFEIVFQTLQGKYHYFAGNLQQLKKRLIPLTRERNYVLQQGIDLARYGGSPFDLRVLMQKDGTGQWSNTGIGIRVAGKDAISTHVPMGGSIAGSPEVLRSLFGSQAPAITATIQSTSLEIASHLEQEEGKNLGEISMDLGMENDGRLWFFEANAKPMKFDEPDIRKRSLQRLIQYFLYLSGFAGDDRRGG